MPTKKKGGETGSDKPAVVVQALNFSDRRVQRDAQEAQDIKQAREGSDPYWIASQIWSPDDALERMHELGGYEEQYKDAQFGAILLRVLTLACHAWNPHRFGSEREDRLQGLHDYSSIIHKMGIFKKSRKIFHRAVWMKREYSGLLVELENSDTESTKHERSLYHILRDRQGDLGCKQLLDWLQGQTNHFGNKKFNDYTNLLMRLDADLPQRSTPSGKLRLHKGDFASYMTQLLSGKSPKDILNPISTDIFALEGLTPVNSSGYAIGQKYEVKDVRAHGQGYFNVNHDYDQLDHQFIDSAIKSYPAGSSMFWTSFVLASLVDAIEPSILQKDLENKIRMRANRWREQSKRLPIPGHMIDTAEYLAIQFGFGFLTIQFNMTPTVDQTFPEEFMHVEPDEVMHVEPDEVMHVEPDEVDHRVSTRPGIVNCTTPTAFARAEHREPMRNHFYS
jgi:hypothetical protein